MQCFLNFGMKKQTNNFRRYNNWYKSVEKVFRSVFRAHYFHDLEPSMTELHY